MKFLIRLYHFLGGIYLAIALITTTALFVIAGTLIESKTESHRYASHFTYGNPVFIALLWLFFINILFAALRRWPFRLRHIPFLITHWGLLMLLAGSLVKSYYGVQGSMEVLEGSASQELYLPNTYVIKLEKRDKESPLKPLVEYHELKHSLLRGFERVLTGPGSEVEISLVEYAPHSSERLESWIKGDKAYITGLKPFAVHPWKKMKSEAENHLFSPTELPISSRVKLNSASGDSPWNLYAFSTPDVAELAKHIYLQQLEITLSDRNTQKELFRGPLEKGLSQTIDWEEGHLGMQLHFEFSSVNGFENPLLVLNVRRNHQGINERIGIPLSGQESLSHINALSLNGDHSIHVAMHKIPAIAFVRDPQEDLFVFAFDPEGRVHAETFRHDNLNALIAYDGGYSGYGVQCALPFAKGTVLESPLTASRRNEIPQKKMEDNLPKITIKLKKGEKVDYATLTYDRFGQGLKWPVFNGDYLVRFQPLFQKIPYRIRLRRARQVNYANSSQPYSYESDLMITDLNKNHAVEKTISMNNVYETWEGYRFYLSNISSSNETAIKRIQIVVNHDPAKYLLTYPGAVILSTGIMLLFWLQPYRKKH